MGPDLDGASTALLVALEGHPERKIPQRSGTQGTSTEHAVSKRRNNERGDEIREQQRSVADVGPTPPGGQRAEQSCMLGKALRLLLLWGKAC